MPRVPSIDVVDLTGPDVPVVDSQYQATPASSGTGARPTVASASSGGSRGSTSASTSRAISGLVYASTLPSASSQHRHTRSNVTSARSRRFTVHQTVVPRSHSSSSSSGAGGSPLFSGSRLPTNPSPRGSGGSMMLPGAFLMPVLFSSMLGGLGVDVEADVFSSSTGFESLLNLNPFEPMLDLAERRAEQLTFLLQSIPSIRSMMRGPPPAAKKSVRALKTTRVTTAMRKLQDGCPICLDDFKKNARACELKCEHFFHSKCIKAWLKTRNTCPVCRYELETDCAHYEETRQRKNASHEALLAERKRRRSESLTDDMTAGATAASAGATASGKSVKATRRSEPLAKAGANSGGVAKRMRHPKTTAATQQAARASAARHASTRASGTLTKSKAKVKR